MVFFAWLATVWLASPEPGAPLVTTSPARLALVNGPQGFAERMATMLAGESMQIRPASSPEDLAQALDSHVASVLVVDWSSLRQLPGSVFEAARNGAGIPIVAVGCPDSVAVEKALETGASLAVRSDAAAAELRSVVDASAARRDLARECEQVHQDLARHAALLIKDDLTAAYNRRFFDRFLGEQVEQARSGSHSVGLIFMDIDNLKAVNVKHGHSMGSLVLREAAARVIRIMGPDDRVMRYGGDEFCIVLPRRDSAAALEVAESVRKAFAASPFAVDATGGVTLTASFGVACFPGQADTAPALVRAADKAMLRVKDQKNGIQLAERA